MNPGVAAALRQQLAAGVPTIVVRVDRAQGSTPRDHDATMLVTASAIEGTIGGGRLEWMAIERARAMLREAAAHDTLDVPLGPAVGQCCGGHVQLALTRADTVLLAALEADEARERANWPSVVLFGAGHVGRALAVALEPLPLAVTVIETRAEYLAALPPRIRGLPSADAPAEIRVAPTRSAFVVATHSHQLDYAITEAALARGDATYVGMIGSVTKRVRFARWFAARGGDPVRLGALVCPIGGQGVRDKRPTVIAAFVAAEVLASALRAQGNADREGRDGRNRERAGRDRPAA
ncbi:MAG: xanthine dehydrogenase accessory protein XdhC [Alphaproteobacteria bacterium]|nr:xanthine dehydrogenase accessory protein XdhC [Alphaproteobacteria bacterium]